MVGVNKEAMAAEMAKKDFSHEEQKATRKTLRDLQKNDASLGPSDENVRVFCALMRLQRSDGKGTDICITPGMLKTWKAPAIQATVFKQD